MAHNWVEPSKRERKRVLNYSEAEYYKQVRRTAGSCGSYACINLSTLRYWWWLCCASGLQHTCLAGM
jgi:hypothetical protein